MRGIPGFESSGAETMADYRYTRHAKQTGAESGLKARDEDGGAGGPVEPAAGVAVLRGDAPDPADPLGGTTAPEDVTKALRRRRGSGKPLQPKDASTFGESYGADLSGVRLHTDGEADVLARSVGAAAFTYGSDVYFANGNYSEGPEGKRLLAHELAHVAQQGSAPSASSASAAPVIGKAGDSHEHEADRMADGALSEMRRSVASPAATEEPAVQRMTVAELVKLHESFIEKAAGKSKLDDVIEAKVEAKVEDVTGSEQPKVSETKVEEAKVEEAKEKEADVEEKAAVQEEAKTEQTEQAAEGGGTGETKTEETKVGEATTEGGTTEEGKTEGGTTEGGTPAGATTEEAKTEGGTTEGGTPAGATPEEGKTGETKPEEGKTGEGKTGEELKLDSAEIDGKTESKVDDAAGKVDSLQTSAANELKDTTDDGKTPPSAKVGSLKDLYMKYGQFLAASQILAGSRNKSGSEKDRLRKNVLSMLAGDRWMKTMKELKYADFVTFISNRRDSLLKQAEELLEKLKENLKSEEGVETGDEASDDSPTGETDEDAKAEGPTDEQIAEELLNEAKKTVGVDGGVLLDADKPVDTKDDEAPVNGDGWKRFAVGQGNDLHLIPAADEEIKLDNALDGGVKLTGEILVDGGVIKGLSGDPANNKIEDLVAFLTALREKGVLLDFPVKGLAGPQDKKAIEIVESKGAKAGGAGAATSDEGKAGGGTGEGGGTGGGGGGGGGT